MAPTSISAWDLVNDSRLLVRFFGDYTYHYHPGGATRWKRQILLGQSGRESVWLQSGYSHGDSKGSKLRAIKVVPKESSQSSDPIDYTRELLAIAKFSQTKYENIFVRSFGWYQDILHVLITMEYFEHGDLRNYLREPLPEHEAQGITAQLILGLACMHSNGFVHGDLEPKNIFVVSKRPNWWVKIGNFGISKLVQESTTLVYTSCYLAPETVALPGETNLTYTPAADMWSLGVTVCHLLTGRGPTPQNKNVLAYIKKLSKSSFDVLFSKNTSQEAHEFLRGLLATNPDNRLPAREALHHDWVNKSNEEQVDSNTNMSLAELFATLSLSGVSEGSLDKGSLDVGGIRPTMSPSQLDGNTTSEDITARQIRNPNPANPTNRKEEVSRAIPPSAPTALRSPVTSSYNFGSFSAAQQTIRTINEFGRQLFDQGAYSEAEVEFRLALQGQEQQGCETATDTLHWLGCCLLHRGRYTEAETKLRHAMEELEKIPDHDPKRLFASIHWLGRALFCQSKFEEADMRFQQAARGQEKILGNDHRDTLDSIHWLGCSLLSQKRYQEAEIYFRLIVEVKEKSPSYDFRDRFASIHWLGPSLFRQRKYTSLENCLETLAKSSEGQKTFHDTIYQYGCCLFYQERYEKAEIIFEKLMRLENTKNPTFDINDIMAWYGGTLKYQARVNEAHTIYRRIPTGKVKILDHNDVDPADFIYLLELSSNNEKKYREMKRMLHDEEERQKKTRGYEYSKTHAVANWLGTYLAQVKLKVTD